MPSISCSEFSRLLEQAVESRLPVDAPDLRGHATECADCRTAWLDALLLDGAVAQWKSTGKKTVAPAELTDIVLFRRAAAQEATISVADSQFGTTRSPAKPRRWLTRRTAAQAAMVLAAAVCVAFLSGRLNWRKAEIETARRSMPNASTAIAPVKPLLGVASAKPVTSSSKGTTPQISSPKAIRPGSASSVAEAPINKTPVSGAPVETMVQDAGSAYLNLASEAAQAVSAASVLVPRPGTAGETAPAVEQNNRWVDDVGREFGPVSKNLSQAFEFLMEAVPTEKAPAT
jgi:hypothetical protein